MENKINKDDFKHIDYSILLKTRALRHVPVGTDNHGQVTLIYLNRIINAPDPEFIKNLDFVYQDLLINSSAQSSLVDNGRLVPEYQIIWGRIIVASYYFYHDDKKWINKGIPALSKYLHFDVIRESIKKGMDLVDEYYQQAKEWNEYKVPSVQKRQQESPKNTQELEQQIADLQQQIADKDARIKELEALLAHPHLSFIETEGKSPQKIQWAYQDIARFVKKPAMMAVCLIDLQTNGMLKGQERYGDLENIKAIHDELKEKYGIKWTYAALCKAINKAKAKKQIH